MRGFGNIAISTVAYFLILTFFKDGLAEPRIAIRDAPHPLPVPTCFNCEPKDNNRIKGQPSVIPSSVGTSNEAINGQGPGADAKETRKFIYLTDKLNAEKVTGISGEEAKSPKLRAQPQTPSKNETNPFVDIFQISDPATKNMLDAVYGSYSGDDQCRRKSFCIMGNYIKDMPGRDLFFMLLGGYIPPEYSLYYDIFRNSVLYGQNCNVYVCIPAATPDPALQNLKPQEPSQKSQPR